MLHFRPFDERIWVSPEKGSLESKWSRQNDEENMCYFILHMNTVHNRLSFHQFLAVDYTSFEEHMLPVIRPFCGIVILKRMYSHNFQRKHFHKQPMVTIVFLDIKIINSLRWLEQVMKMLWIPPVLGLNRLWIPPVHAMDSSSARIMRSLCRSYITML